MPGSTKRLGGKQKTVKSLCVAREVGEKSCTPLGRPIAAPEIILWCFVFQIESACAYQLKSTTSSAANRDPRRHLHSHRPFGSVRRHRVARPEMLQVIHSRLKPCKVPLNHRTLFGSTLSSPRGPCRNKQVGRSLCTKTCTKMVTTGYFWYSRFNQNSAGKRKKCL
jgi:hypothetical protein